MIRGLSGRIVVLVLAIVFVIGMWAVRNQKPAIEDPVGDAQQNLLKNFGFEVERQVSSTAGGLIITQVKAGSVAAQLGLHPKDIVLAINERSVWHAQQLDELLLDRLSKGPVRMMVKNNGVYRMVWFGAGRHSGGSAGSPGAGRMSPRAERSGGSPPSRRGPGG